QGDRFSAEAVAARVELAERYHRLWHRLLSILEEASILRRDGNGWEVVAVLAQPDPEGEARHLADRFPEMETELALLQRCGTALARVLRGTCDPLQELLIPEGDVAATAAVYRDTHAARLLNEVMREALAAALAQVPARRGVRILEIGAGTGGTTA